MADTIELNTLGSVLKSTYEGQPDTNAFTDAEKLKLDSMSDTTFSGAYADLTGKPALFSGAWPDLTGKPAYIAAGASRAAVMTDIGAIPASQKGQANGVAPLDASGLVPLAHLNVGGLSFKGAWSPVTNTPVLINGTGSVGDFYKAEAAGTFNFGNGDFNFLVGDWAIYAGGTWQRIGTSDAVAMVNGKLGNVVLTAADVGALPSSYAAPVASVNGKTGVAVLTAADVSALPSSYTPPAQAWPQISGKPDFAALYQPKQRGTIGPAISAALIRKTANQAIATGVTTTLTGFVSVYDQFGLLASGSQIVIPAWAKYARISGSVQWGGASGSNTNPLRASVLINGSAIPGVSAALRFGNINVMSTEFFTGIVPVATGDIVTLTVAQSTTATRNVEVGTDGGRTWLQVELYE